MTKDNQEKTWNNGGKKLKETEVTARNGAKRKEINKNKKNQE